MRRCLLRLAAFAALLALTVACFPKSKPLDVQVCREPMKKDFRDLPTTFPPLEPHERKEEWGREYQMGIRFARDFDLYRAITAFKRSLYLMPRRNQERRLEAQYYIALSYFLGERWCELIETIEEGPLLNITSDFPAYQELLVMLHTAYLHTSQCDKACSTERKLQAIDPALASRIELGSAVQSGDLMTLSNYRSDPAINHLVNNYCHCRKSIKKAQTLSAILPGAGFWYVGQRQSAITAAALNALFIAAAVQLFRHGHYAAGAFVTSLEIGWYTGGIYGAGEAAHLYNSRLYEKQALPVMQSQKLYPYMALRWSF